MVFGLGCVAADSRRGLILSALSLSLFHLADSAHPFVSNKETYEMNTGARLGVQQINFIGKDEAPLKRRLFLEPAPLQGPSRR